MDERRRHKRAFRFFNAILKPFIKHKFNLDCESLQGVPRPYLLLPNHNLELDPLLVGAVTNEQIYFVASEHITRKGLGSRFLMRYFKPIIHVKGRMGVNSSLEMIRTLRRGDNVCLFPEGNRSFNGLTGYISPAAARLARSCGAAVVTYVFEGGYFSQPRWSRSLRRGRMTGRVANVYTKEQLRAMDEGQIYDAICADLREDAYLTQQRAPVAFRGKALAENIETTLFLCPCCGGIDKLESRGDTFTCESCGSGFRYNEFGMIVDSDGNSSTVTQWDLAQREKLRQIAAAAGADQPLFSDELAYIRIGAAHSVAESGSGKLTAYADRFRFNDKEYRPEDILGASIFSRNIIVAHIGDEMLQYELRGNDRFCALKYLYLYQDMAQAEKQQRGDD